MGVGGGVGGGGGEFFYGTFVDDWGSRERGAGSVFYAPCALPGGVPTGEVGSGGGRWVL